MKTGRRLFFYLGKAQENNQEKKDDDPFGLNDEEDKVAKLAKHFEEKYGTKGPRDIGDLGEGYDVNDPFVDDTELAEASVPPGWTTQHGGFYIGQGPLLIRKVRPKEEETHVFESLDAEECLTEMKAQASQPKRRVIEDSDEVDSEEEDFKPKRKKAVVKDPFDDDDMEVPPIAAVIEQPVKKSAPKTVASLLAKSKEHHVAKLNDEIPVERPAVVTKPSVEVQKKEAVPAKPQQKRAESVTSSQGDGKSWQVSEGKWDPSLGGDETSVKLRETVQMLTQLASGWDGGKCNFFSVEHNPVVRQLLLGLEYECRRLRCGLRSAVYSYLADRLPCSKETLIKRAKTFREQDVEQKTASFLRQLAEAIQNEPASGNGTDSATRAFKPHVKKLISTLVKKRLDVYDVHKARFATQEDYVRSFVDTDLMPLWRERPVEKELVIAEALMALADYLRPKPKSANKAKPQITSHQDQKPQLTSLSQVPLISPIAKPHPVKLSGISKSGHDQHLSNIPKSTNVKVTAAPDARKSVIRDGNSSTDFPTDLSAVRKVTKPPAVHQDATRSARTPPAIPIAADIIRTAAKMVATADHKQKPERSESKMGNFSGSTYGHQSASGSSGNEQRSPFVTPSVSKSSASIIRHPHDVPRPSSSPNKMETGSGMAHGSGSAFKKAPTSAESVSSSERHSSGEKRRDAPSPQERKHGSSSTPKTPKSSGSKSGRNSSSPAFNPAGSFSVASLTSPFIPTVSNRGFHGLPALPEFIGFGGFGGFGAETINALLGNNLQIAGSFSNVPGAGRSSHPNSHSSSNGSSFNPNSRGMNQR